MSGDWNRLQEIFDGALARLPEDRAAYLDEACVGEPELRERAVTLLACDANSERFLEPSGDGLDLLATSSVNHDSLGRDSVEVEDPYVERRIGPYRIVSLIARGGMGAVYRGERVGDDIERTVAIKILKRGLDTDEILGRFHIERQVLARLEHSHIARFYDGGATDDGVPFLVMELVDGLRIDHHCDRERLGVRERVELFIDVCHAVQFAHHRLIVHRDLKPSNILVTSTGEPKLLDFGIAKVLDPEAVGEPVAATVTQLRIMTPGYASPEQVRGEPATVSTDVYSLGVILYELLCGRSPHPIRSNRIEEIERVICEREPTRPSTALTHSAEGLPDTTAIAEARHTDTRRLRSVLSGDIATIAMKALAKEPHRRYASPGHFAEDLLRYLDGRPVEARPATWGYRVRKYVGRNVVGLTVATVFLLVVAIAGVVTVRQQFELGIRGDDLTRLMDMRRIDSAVSVAERLWPIDPTLIPSYLEWFAEWGQPLNDRKSEHFARLTEVQTRALPRTAEDERIDREFHRDFEEYDRLRRVVAERRRTLGADHDLGKIAQRLAEFEARVSQQRTWRFENPRDEYLEATLFGLTKKLHSFLASDHRDGVYANMKWRLALARGLEAREAELHEAWDDARAEIQRSPIYGGLELPQQCGLLPIGPDPMSGLHEFVDVLTGDRPPLAPEGSPGRFAMNAKSGIVYVLLPGGRFEIGAQSHDPGAKRYDSSAVKAVENPIASVNLDPFFVSKFEITQAQWSRLAWENSHYYTGFKQVSPAGNAYRATLTHPVERVDWREARDVLLMIGAVLPTEAQWEYAARAGDDTPWPGSPDVSDLGTIANIADATLSEFDPALVDALCLEVRDGWPFHAPVGSFRPNRFGLHDTLGNVREWCQDPRGPYTAAFSPGDGSRLEELNGWRMVRGGSFKTVPSELRVSHRTWWSEQVTSSDLGIRPVRRIVGSDER